MGWLVKVRSGGADRLVTLSGELTIGRSVDGDGGLPDDRKISRRHARFLLDPGGGLAIEDLRSANGTAVNGFGFPESTSRCRSASSEFAAQRGQVAGP